MNVNGTEPQPEPVNEKKNEWLKYVLLHRTRLKSCDMQRELYTLYNEKDNVVYNMTAHACERPFVVLPIPNSNLILLVIDQLCPRDVALVLTVNPNPVNYPLAANESFPCYKHAREFNRVRPQSCISRHANVSHFYTVSTDSFTNYFTFLSSCRRAASSCVEKDAPSMRISCCCCSAMC